MVVTITDEEVRSLAQSILVRYGIDFTCYEPKSLKRRITRIINNLNYTSIHELWVRFLRDQHFIQEFMNEISVGMTSMFRDPVVWRTMRNLVTPEFGKKDVISIWHAGCSTGEEVYSMGILLKESHLLRKSHRVATDINLDAINTAKEGAYHKIKMIENENNFRHYSQRDTFSNYYKTGAKDCTMNQELLFNTQFSYNNLITDALPAPGKFDIIFCRNVMIYFDGIAKAKLLDKFYNALTPGGWFVIGFFDTMGSLIDSTRFRLIDPEVKIFRKI